MSQITATAQTFASGRYSKRKRTQVAYVMDELDVSDTESDFETVPVKKRKAVAPKPLPKSKIFPFMELPAEIRNIIYNYAFVEPSGIDLVATSKNKRRVVERISADAQASISGDSFRYSVGKMNRRVRARYESPVTLMPALLAVNKQIYQEGRDLLYGNDFIFTDTSALYSFMINIGPVAAKLVKSVRIMDWGFGRALKSYNHSCFAVLAMATNLESLQLDKLAGYSSTATGAAEQFYRDGFPWLEAMGAAKGKLDAGVDVVKLSDRTLEYWGNRQRSQGSPEEKDAEFREALGELLSKQRERVMAKPVKRKTAKNGKKDEL